MILGLALGINSHAGKSFGESLLLDNFTGAARAFSFRKLLSSYTGDCIRVRRSNDNAESDIGFAGDGWLDESALTAFVGANSAFITTWYEQFENGNAVQTDTSRQPRIVNAGTIDKAGGRPCIQGVSNDYLEMGYYIPKLASSFAVGQCTTTNDILYGAFNSGDSYAHFFGTNSGGAYDAGYGNALFAAPDAGASLQYERVVMSNVGNNTTMRTLLNDTVDFTQTPSTVSEATTPASNYAFILANNAGGAGFYTTGLIQELIIFESDKQSDAAEIMANMNEAFTVY